MRSLIGELIFGVGISLLAGAFLLIWDKLSNQFRDLWGTYLGVLIIFGIILIIVGAKRIDKYKKMKGGKHEN